MNKKKIGIVGASILSLGILGNYAINRISEYNAPGRILARVEKQVPDLQWVSYLPKTGESLSVIAEKYHGCPQYKGLTNKQIVGAIKGKNGMHSDGIRDDRDIKILKPCI